MIECKTASHIISNNSNTSQENGECQLAELICFERHATPPKSYYFAEADAGGITH